MHNESRYVQKNWIKKKKKDEMNEFCLFKRWDQALKEHLWYTSQYILATDMTDI